METTNKVIKFYTVAGKAPEIHAAGCADCAKNKRTAVIVGMEELEDLTERGFKIRTMPCVKENT